MAAGHGSRTIAPEVKFAVGGSLRRCYSAARGALETFGAYSVAVFVPWSCCMAVRREADCWKLTTLGRSSYR